MNHLFVFNSEVFSFFRKCTNRSESKVQSNSIIESLNQRVDPEIDLVLVEELEQSGHARPIGHSQYYSFQDNQPPVEFLSQLECWFSKLQLLTPCDDVSQ